MGKKEEFSDLTEDRLGQLILNLHIQIQEFESILAKCCCTLSYFTYTPIRRQSQQRYPKEIAHIDKRSGDAKDYISGLYNYENKHDGITVPTKRVGVLSVSDDMFCQVKTMADEINATKQIIKTQAPILIPVRSERRRFFDIYASGVITSTIYRKIPVLNDVRSASYYWCDSQFTMLESSYDEAIRLVNQGGQGHKEHETTIHRDRRLELVKAKLQEHLNSGASFYRYMSLRVHPVQQVYYSKDKKTSLKVSCPLIVSNSSAVSLEQAEIKPFCDSHQDNYYPDKVGRHTHCGFGLYAKKL